VSVFGTTAEFSTGENIKVEYWNQLAQEYCSNSKSKNENLNTLLHSIAYKLKQNSFLVEFTNAKELIASLRPKQIKKVLLQDLIVDFINNERVQKSTVLY
jgi:hypothetical protein